MSQKVGTVEAVVMPHAVPQRIVFVVTLMAYGVDLEGDISCSSHGLDCPQVALAQISLVTRNLIDGEVLSCGLDEWGQVRRVGGFGRGYFNAGHDVGFDPTHQVGFYPLCLFPHLAPFVVKPTVVDRRGEAAGIHSEIYFHGPQWQGTLLNQGLQQRGQVRIFQVAESAGKGRSFVQQSFGLCIREICHCPSPGHGGIDLNPDAEEHVRKWQPRPSKVLWRLRNRITQLTEQGHEVLLLMGLRRIVGRPVLPVGNPHSPGIDGRCKTAHRQD